mgnify:CR=1 FL=1
MHEVILSVGIDIGTSTTQLIFSRLTIENRASSYTVPRIDIVDKEVVYRSKIYFTPLRSATEIDAEAVKQIVREEYQAAGMTPEMLRTGAVIITGETARKENANEVLEALSDLAGDFVVATAGPDLESVLSARGAGILGFSIFGTRPCYALDEHMELDLDGVRAFLEEHQGETIFLFGFTFMIWKHVVRALEERGERLDIPNGILVHGGGWKKLAGEAVSPGEFKARVAAATGVERVSNYYGMAEQTGCIYMECPQGHLHASLWSDIVVRRGRDYRPCEPGEEGVLQVLSPLPRSYPGHSLLTEDLGVLLGEDDCPCGRKGKYFKVTGRVPRAEVRGCSDTYED